MTEEQINEMEEILSKVAKGIWSVTEGEYYMQLFIEEIAIIKK